MYSNWQCFFYISLILFMHIVFLKKLASLVTCTYPKWGEFNLSVAISIWGASSENHLAGFAFTSRMVGGGSV